MSTAGTIDLIHMGTTRTIEGSTRMDIVCHFKHTLGRNVRTQPAYPTANWGNVIFTDTDTAITGPTYRITGIS